ncbi:MULTISPECIES: MarR family winged helix-turn-helix transcriptional regulator [Thioclava]|uniref:MarR family transcriptional regulator n=1 Tax=Thioclava electrotropha TaxID=1549850 RepID=A0ABX6YPS7_9RHOB|nr:MULTISPECIES: MarR family transcriptional regulator [Thioclava]MPQ94565.1 MarR family transcriptional regulator [Thioclava sp. JE_KL1]QPZ89678.1 MarR family transcriptional regulator [Thioclava electrotropha]
MPDQSLGFLLHDATRLIRRRFEARANEFGLTTAQWRLLVYLKKEGALPQARLAELLEIEPISVSRLVDRMEEADWVCRKPDPNDRRVKLVHPSAKARNAFENARSIADDIYEQALAGLSDDEVATALNTLRAIIRNLSEDTSSTSETNHE